MPHTSRESIRRLGHHLRESQKFSTLKSDGDIAVIQVNVSRWTAIDRIVFLLAVCQRRPTGRA
jgi:hypothetical protein